MTTNCNEYEYPESITPTDTSDHLVVHYDSFGEITQPDPNHIYIIDGTAYVFDGMQYISIGVACEACPEYEEYEGATEVTTQDADIVLSTNGKMMNSDITIHHGHDIETALLENTAIDEYYNDSVTTLFNADQFYASNIKKLSLPNLTQATGAYCFNGNGVSLLEELYLPGITISGWQAYCNNPNLKIIDVGQTFADQKVNNNPNLNVLIIRNTTFTNIASSWLAGTKLESGGDGGYVYVRQALLSQYQADTSWQTYANVLEFRAIEGSIYE